ncbi:MAG: DUF1186 domain-containing protein [Cyanobacteria bacterium J06627_15]
MELDAIIAALIDNGTHTFPEQTVRAAIEQQEAITPRLLQVLEETGQDLEAVREQSEYMLHIYAMFLLAQFRETRAYPLLYQIAATPGDIVYDIMGDVLTEDFGRILASVCGGDLSLIKQLIEAPDVDDSVRGAGLQALLTLVVEGEISRESVLDYFQQVLAPIDEQDSPLGTAIAIYALDLTPNEAILTTLRAAYEKGVVDPVWSDLDDFSGALKEDPTEAAEYLKQNRHYRYVTDVVEAMPWWHCFSDDKPKPLPTRPMGMEIDTGREGNTKKKAKAKKKRKQQKQSRKQNRQKKK